MSLKLFELMATVGLDTSAYKQGINTVQSETKKAVTSLAGEYSKAAKSVVELTQKYNESAAKTGKTSAETRALKKELSAAEAQMKTTAAALKAANNGMDKFGVSAKNSGNSLTMAITKANLLSGVFSKLYASALTGAKQLVQMGISYNAQIESYRVGLTNMLGDAEAANAAMQAIQEDAARTPFSVDSLTQANQLLISAGENAQYSEKVIMALGNAVSATGGGNAELSRMAANLQQIANVGKAASVDIKQFAYAGINIYQVLADYTGKTVQEVQNMTISYDVLSQALIAASEEGGRYYNAMDTQSQTMNGRVSTLKDNVSQLAGLLTGPLSEGVGVVISNLNDLVVAAQEGYKQDGWLGLAGAITGLTEPIESAKSHMRDFAANSINWLDQMSYRLNNFLGKASVAGYSSPEEYAAAMQSQRNKDARRQDALAGKGISNKSWTERQAEAAAAAAASTTSSLASSSSDSGKSSSSKAGTTAQKTAQIINQLTENSQKVVGDVTTDMKKVTAIYDDGTSHITETVTTSQTSIVDGVKQTSKTIETYVDGVKTKVDKTVDNVVRSVTKMQEEIDSNLSEAQKQWSNGIFGRLQSTFSDLKSRNWAGLATDAAKLIWGEVSQEQKEIISKWAADALTAINESYSGGGMKAAYERLHELFTSGISEGVTEAGTAIQSFNGLLDGMSASGGAAAKLASVATRVQSMSTSVIGSLGGIVSFISANPILAAVLGVTALAGGVGLGLLWKKRKKAQQDTDTTNSSSGLSYKDIQDAYWYGNMRSYAGYDFRADGYAFSEGPAGGKLTAYQQKMQASVDALYTVVQQYLPQTANTVIKLDDGTLVGALAPAMDAQLGNLATLAERGN